jgi:hypothetical protein
MELNNKQKIEKTLPKLLESKNSAEVIEKY